MYLPNDINDIKEIVNYLNNNIEFKMVVQETKEVDSVKDVIYRK